MFVEEDTGNGSYQTAAQWTTDTIDLSYHSYPFPDVADDRWRLTVVGLVELPEGERYALRLVADGEVRVFVDGELVISSVDGTDGPREVVAEFRHPPRAWRRYASRCATLAGRSSCGSMVAPPKPRSRRPYRRQWEETVGPCHGPHAMPSTRLRLRPRGR